MAKNVRDLASVLRNRVAGLKSVTKGLNIELVEKVFSHRGTRPLLKQLKKVLLFFYLFLVNIACSNRRWKTQTKTLNYL